MSAGARAQMTAVGVVELGLWIWFVLMLGAEVVGDFAGADEPLPPDWIYPYD